MTRTLKWQGDEFDGYLDLIGLLGPIRTFSIAQQTGNNNNDPIRRWELVSFWIPCKQRRRVFDDVDTAKAAAQKTVDDFTAWLTAGT